MSEINKKINEELLPKAVATMLILMDNQDSKIKFEAAKEVLNGTIFKKASGGNSVVFNLKPEQLSSAVEILEGLNHEKNKEISVGEFEESE